MTLLVLDGDAPREVLARAGDEDVIVIDLLAARLEELERRRRPARLLPDRRPAILPLPDGSVDEAVGEGVEPELRRVLKREARRRPRHGPLGQAAAALLERNGVEVVRVDRELGNDEDVSLLEGADVLVKSPGVPR